MDDKQTINKDKTLAVLKTAEGPVSGAVISVKLGVSRAAVWKYIEALREDGFKIEGVSNQGYKLTGAPDLLMPAEIKPYLPAGYLGNIYWSRSISSTNDKAKELAVAGAPNGTLVVAENQKSGRGRRGREWQSPAGGIWFSLVLRPGVSVLLASRISVFAAVIAAEEIAAVAGIGAAIKWPNDILIGGKKVCGILIELAAELDRIAYVVIGIGINANLGTGQFSPEVRAAATTLFEETGKKIDRRLLLGKIAGRLTAELPAIFNDGYRDYIDRWRRLSAILGQRIKLEDSGLIFIGKAVDIEDNGALIVELDNGERRVFESGEVSLRLSDNK